jgi:hypothetical protein
MSAALSPCHFQRPGEVVAETFHAAGSFKIPDYINDPSLTNAEPLISRLAEESSKSVAARKWQNSICLGS